MRINYYLVEPVSGCVIMCFFPVAFTANGASVLNSKRFTEWLLWILCEMSSFIVHQQWRMIFDERTIFFFGRLFVFNVVLRIQKKGTILFTSAAMKFKAKKKNEVNQKSYWIICLFNFFSHIILNSLSLMAQCFWRNNTFIRWILCEILHLFIFLRRLFANMEIQCTATGS